MILSSMPSSLHIFLICEFGTLSIILIYPNTQQTSDIFCTALILDHSFSLYHCLTALEQNRDEQCLIQHPHTLKLHIPSINQGPYSTFNFPSLATFLVHLEISVLASSNTNLNYLNSDTCSNITLQSLLPCSYLH